jgi:hypothetical protein
LVDFTAGFESLSSLDALGIIKSLCI